MRRILWVLVVLTPVIVIGCSRQPPPHVGSSLMGLVGYCR